MIFKSIKWRLLLWMAFLLTLILTGLGISIYEIHLAGRLDQFDDRLRHRVATLGAALYNNQNTNLSNVQFSPEINRLFQTKNTNGFYYVVWQRDRAEPLKKSKNAPGEITRPQPVERDTGTYIRSDDRGREAYRTTEQGDCALVGHIVTTELAAAGQFARWTIFGGIGVLLFALAGAWWLVTRALRPLEKISAAAQKISSGNLAQRISVAESEGELGKLAAVLNSTFARLEAAFAQQKQFTSDASHELRTPIAVLISEAQTTLARERSPEDYREALAASLDTAKKMARLTESLLELARLDAGQEMLRREKFFLHQLAEEGIKLVRPLADQRQIKLHSEFLPAEISGDATRLAQVITNLLTNAINYNREAGEIRVATRVENGMAVLLVADTGRGIAAKDLPRVFERFYRADKSRSGGNAGLGLAISKAVVEAHGGTIEVLSVENSGTTFTVRLPV
ncbi:MAG: hypothetical protein RL616_1445 [Verrucomicrobiota bacterium]|jgi:heavy metal sensor kinase